MSPVKWLALATCAVAACLGSAFPASAANIRGVVQFTGTGGEPKKMPVTIDQYVCGKDKDAEDLQMGPQRGVRNAVVWIQNPPPGARGDARRPGSRWIRRAACSCRTSCWCRSAARWSS